MIGYSTPKRLLKKRIQHRIDILQERKIRKNVNSLEDLKNNISNFKKHFDDSVFLDFSNIAEEEKQVIFLVFSKKYYLEGGYCIYYLIYLR